MGYFPSTIAASLAGDTVRLAMLARFAFASQEMRLWDGTGPLLAGGETWLGAGAFGKVSDIESALGGASPQVTFTLSGVDPALMADVINAPNEVSGRDVTIYMQFFNSASQPLDNPYAIWVGAMDLMKFRADGPSTRTVEVTAETLFTRRGTPPWGSYSDRSQQQMFPGDFGLSMMSSIPFKTVDWPVF